MDDLNSTQGIVALAAAGIGTIAFVWVIVPIKSNKASTLKPFIKWALSTGQTFGPKLLFVPVPKAVKTAGLKTLARVHS